MESQSVSRSIVFNSLQSHGLQPARLLWPCNSPGKNTGVVCHSFLQGIFQTQESNMGLLHWRQILYHLSHQGSPHNARGQYTNTHTHTHTHTCTRAHTHFKVVGPEEHVYGLEWDSLALKESPQSPDCHSVLSSIFFIHIYLWHCVNGKKGCKKGCTVLNDNQVNVGIL